MYRNSKILLVAGFILIGIVILNVGSHYYSKYYHQKMRSYPKMYCYRIKKDNNVVNPAYLIKNRKYKDSLIGFYIKDEKGEEPNYLNFPFRIVPEGASVYVLGYYNDSTLAKIMCYYDFGRGDFYLKGYIDTKTLHITPP